MGCTLKSIERAKIHSFSSAPFSIKIDSLIILALIELHHSSPPLDSEVLDSIRTLNLLQFNASEPRLRYWQWIPLYFVLFYSTKCKICIHRLFDRTTTIKPVCCFRKSETTENFEEGVPGNRIMAQKTLANSNDCTIFEDEVLGPHFFTPTCSGFEDWKTVLSCANSFSKLKCVSANWQSSSGRLCHFKSKGRFEWHFTKMTIFHTMSTLRVGMECERARSIQSKNKTARKEAARYVDHFWWLCRTNDIIVQNG